MKKAIHITMVLLCILAANQFAYSATRTASVTGNWSNTNTWGGAAAPVAGDDVVINSGITVTVDGTNACSSISITGGTSNGITISGTNSLTVTNGITYNNPSGSNTQTVAIGTGSLTCGSITFNATSNNNRVNTLTISTGSLTVTGNISMPGSNAAKNTFVCSGAGTITIGGSWTVTTATITPSTAKFIYNGAAAQAARGLTYQKLVFSGAGSKTLAGAVVVTDTFTIESDATLNNSGSTNLTTNGVFYVQGTYNETNTGGSVTFAGGVNIASGGTMSCSIAETFVFSGGGLINNGTYSCGTNNITTFQTNAQAISGSGTTSFFTVNVNIGVTNNTAVTVNSSMPGSNTWTQGSGSVLNYATTTSLAATLAASASANTVNYSFAGTQTVKATTYRNLILSVSGAKTTTSVTVNDTLFMQGTATASVAPTYGTSATLQYNTASNVTAGPEWITPFVATGGVQIANTGIISLNAAKQIGNNTNIPLTIQSGATLSTSGSNFGLTFHGDFTNSGTLTGGSSTITIGGTTTAHNIGTFTTTGTVSMTKTGGTATFTGNVNGAALTINGASGTINAGLGRTHTFTGDITLTAGTLNGSSSTINANATSATAWTGTGSNFTASTSTVSFGGGAQTINTATTFNNLTIATAGVKTMAAAITVSGTLTITNGTLTLGANTLTLNGDFVGTSSRCLTGSSSSNLTIGGSGSIGNLFFDQTTPGTTNNIATFTINRSGQTISLGNNLQVSTSLTFTAGKLAINNQTLTLNGANTSGNSATNSFVGSTSSNLTINGTGALSNLFFDQTTPGTTNAINNLTYNRASQTITLGNAIQVFGNITPTAGTLATGGFLTMISNASVTSCFGTGSGSYVSGNVTVQRFIPSIARRWRFLASPLSGRTLADWQANVYVTGTGGATNGFDATSSNQGSVFNYDETVITGTLDNGWTGATNITNALTVGKGYRLFIRGDRSDPGRLTGTNTTQNAVTISMTGSLNTGSINLNPTFTSSGTLANDGWNLVANPYASHYDWNAFYDAQNGTGNCLRIDPTIYIFDASSNGYKSFNATSNAGTLTSGIIPSSASFFVKANAASPALTLTETYKTTTVPVSLFKTEEGEGFTMRVQADSISYDEAVVKYMAGSTVNKDSFDITKLATTWVNISVYGPDSQQLTASVRPLALDNDTLLLRVTASVSGTYLLKFKNSDEIAVKEQVLLFDNYTSQVVDLQDRDTLSFTVNTSIPATQGLSRFYIVIANNTSLPVDLLSFGAYKMDNHSVKVNWATAQETNNEKFVIERSEDGTQFEPIGIIAGNGNTQKLLNYQFTDESPNPTNYYRLKQMDFDGTSTYSKTVLVKMDQVISGFSMYPIPAVDRLTIENNEIISQIHIYNAIGNLVHSVEVESKTASIDVEKFEPGIYVVEVINENGESAKEKFVKE